MEYIGGKKIIYDHPIVFGQVISPAFPGVGIGLFQLSKNTRQI